MIVKELREFLSKIPKEITQEQFDNLPILIQTGEDTFDIPDETESGYVIFTNNKQVAEKNLAEDDIPAFMIGIMALEFEDKS